ncbi:hypothetical protein JK386_04930 [Nocardioides sp. zg-536]|uniref:Uncharacterized protein n=1 Tax=Nocardioides faecalis TaxID=2803858 RepID=A0A939BV66_9ACTN|nr:hypothetical protein [Nocardioides faecalis]MBM9459237.1 hypothetical protein [Nocardioides faecalis]QVI59628.1 hypothetical protein KG111_04585 [Nocardioides faecalis]
MTWQTLAVRYISIGEKSARFRDLTLPFNDDGEPVETVIWLPNGGGKSSLMSLKSAVVLPAARDFTGAGREDGEKRPRRLNDYVGSGDTSHTVIEWAAADQTLLGGQNRLLTGAVYEWPERRRPTLEQDATLNKFWWSAVPIPGVLDLATLPVRDGRLLTLSQFRDRLRALNAQHPELQVRIAGTQAAWEEQLDLLRIDTALYRYQARMNTSEGGIAKVFNFNTVRDFIDLVVDVIAAPNQAADCGKVVTSHARNLFRRPALLTERAFLTEATGLLSELVAVHDQFTGARADLAHTQAAASRLRASLVQAAVRTATAATVAAEQARALGEQVSEARRERGRVDGLRAKLAHHAAGLRHTEAVAAHTAAARTAKEAHADALAWAAAGPLAEAAAHDAAAEVLRERLAPERAERAALRERVDTYASAVRDLLTSAAEQLENRAGDTEREAGAHRETASGLGARLRELEQEGNRLHAQLASARALLEQHGREMAAARRNGVLEAAEDPASAHQRHSDAAQAAAGDARRFEEEEARAQQAYEAAADAVAESAGDHARRLAEASQSGAELARLRVAYGKISGNPRFVALAETDNPDVWGDASRVRHALAAAALDADEHALREAVAAADDERLISGVDATGLLPAPAATSTAADELTSAGVPAQPAWTVLARDYQEAERATLAAARPDIASGVVVQDGAARDRALVLLASSPVLVHVPVVTATEVADGARDAADPAPIPSVPLHTGLHSPSAAGAAAEQLRSRGEGRRTRQATLQQRARADRQLLTELAEFLAEWPDADSLTRAEALTRSAADAVENARVEQEAQTQARDQAKEDREAAKKAAAEARRLEQQHLGRAATAATLTDSENTMSGHRTSAAEAEDGIAELTRQDTRLREEQAQEQGAASKAELQTQQLRLEAAAHRRDLLQVGLVEPESLPAGHLVEQAKAAGLGQCRATWEVLRNEWKAASSGSVLEAQLLAEVNAASSARQRADQAISQADDPSEVRNDAEARAGEYTAAACVDEHARSDRLHTGLVAAAAKAEAAADAALQVLKDATEAADRAPKVPDDVSDRTAEEAEDEAARLETQSGTLSATETRLGKEKEAAEGRSKEYEALAESLNDQAGRLPEPDGDAPADAEPFLGDLAAARREVLTAVADLKRAGDDVDAALTLRAALAAEAFKLASRPAYQRLPLKLKDRLTDSDPAALAQQASTYAAEVAVRLREVEALLDQISGDEQRIAQVVSSHVRQLLKGISAAARASTLPPGLGQLTDQQFINLRFTNPSDEELASRVTQEIVSMLDSTSMEAKNLPTGETILRRCVHAAVGMKGFTVTVLKPNEHMVAQRVPVTEVAKFSDGEKLTTCVLLFCAFARMRQAGRAGGATGTLMLDNPFGRASNAQLVALQLAVAKAQRVHLVYATGLEDMGALLQFRRLIRLRNRKPVGTTDGHVQLEAAPGSRVGEVSGVTVSRPSAPVPIELTATP